MYVYVDPKISGDPFTVGFYDPAGKWQPESDHGSRDEAAARVIALNGGAPRFSDRELAMLASCISFLDQDEDILSSVSCTLEEWDALVNKLGAQPPAWATRAFANVNRKNPPL